MNDLLSEMSQDSEDTPDKLDTLNSGKLDGVSRLAQEAALLEQEIAQYEQFVKEKKQALYKITDEQLPEALEEMGLQKFTLTDGAEISVKPIYAASIPKERKEEAFQWPRDHDFGDLVKNNVTVSFGRGEDDNASAFAALAEKEGFIPSQKEEIHASTLRAFIKERVENGDEFPSELFGAYVCQRAVIKRSK